MIIELPDPSQVLLQVVARDLHGDVKSNISAATVRVYHIVASVETEVLSAIGLTQVGVSSTWRYLWEPASLPIGHYVIEYTLIDTGGVTWIGTEDLIVNDFAQEATLVALGLDLAIIKKIETGRWKMVGNQMIFYDDDNVTPLFTFNLFDLVGNPSMDSVFERVPE